MTTMRYYNTAWTQEFLEYNLQVLKQNLYWKFALHLVLSNSVYSLVIIASHETAH